jgi:hypothetical protein
MERYAYNNWKLNVNVTMGEVDVFCCYEQRGYQIPDRITKVEQEQEYIFIYVENGDYYQFKFEEGNFLVGDLFNNQGEFLECFASHVFGEEEKSRFATMISDGHVEYWSYFDMKSQAVAHFELLSLHPDDGCYLYEYNEELGYEVIDSKSEE